MTDLALKIILVMIPIVYVSLRIKDKNDKSYLKKFNERYHFDNAANEYSKNLLKLGKFPYHAFKESNVEKGIKMDIEFLRKRDEYLDSLTLEQHGQLIRGMDSYLMGDVSSVRLAKKIAKEREYKF
ncbi:hypothetical protein [Niallia sp. FSL M8-0099]|uniref:hypothetical protein n=1 Tax=Niallia sp. FSL M8-0099 TaxID=2954519 RepID=UPI0030F4E17F